MENTVEMKKSSYLKFGLLSLLGFLIFLFPVPHPETGAMTLVIGIMTAAFHDSLGVFSDYIIMAMAAIAIFGSLIVTFTMKDTISKKSVAYKLFYCSGLNLIARLIGAVLLLMVAFNIGPAILLDSNVGGTMYGLCVIVGIELIPAIILMPLLVDYGLMEFLGTMVNKFVRPVFRLPGRASVDLLASWVGMVEMGLIVTDDQYERGYYTNREATSIATCFTATGVAFWLVCGEMAGLSEYLIPFFIAIFLVGIIAAFVAVRIPPLSILPDDYHVENENNIDPSAQKPEGMSKMSFAMFLGAEKAEKALPVKSLGKKIVYQNLSIMITLVPLIMIIGVVALALVEYTPVLDWLGYPFALLLNLFGVPEADIAGAAIVSGFADMFLPIILVADAASLQMRFIVTVIGLTQIVFLSEVISYLLNSTIPVKFSHMVFIFIERTVVAILVLVPFTYLFGIM